MAIPSLFGSYIDETFQRLVQTTGSGAEFADGLGNPITFGQTPTGSLLTTASATGNTITFTKGDGSTFPVTVAGGTGAPGDGEQAIQFNSASVFGGSSNLKYDYVNNNIILTGSLLVTQSHISTVDYVDFTKLTLAQIPAHNEGRLHWFDDTKTLQIDTDKNDFMIEVGHQSVVRVYNDTGADITLGKVVRISGSQGNQPGIVTASWEDDSSSAATLGFAATLIAGSGGNKHGYVITNGILRNVDTLVYPVGTQLYLSSSGQFTSTPPDAPLHEVRLGKVIVSNATTGVIYVDIMNGYELTELHDIKTNGLTPGDLLIRSGSLWINSKILTGSYTLSGSLTTNDGVSVQTLTASVVSASSFTGSLFGTASWATSASQAVSASFAPNIYNQDGTLSGNRAVNISTNTLTFTSSRSSGPAFQVTTVQTASNSTDTGDAAMGLSYTLTGSLNQSGTQLVSRVFSLNTTHNRSGSIVTNLRIFNLAANTNTNTTTSNLDAIYIENGTINGVVTNYRGLLINNSQGTNRAGLVVNSLSTGTSTNRTDLLLNQSTIPSGIWSLYSSNPSGSYLEGNLYLGTTTTSNFKLDISGSARITNGLIITGSLNAPSITGSLLGLASTASSADNFTVRNNLIVSGNTTIGDATTDTITMNAATMSLGSGTAIFNIDANTLVIDGTNNRVGIGRIPTIAGVALDVNGNTNISNNLIVTGSITAKGSNTQVQYNDGGTLSGANFLIYDKDYRSVRQGLGNNTLSQYSHAEGANTFTTGYASHTEGNGNTASGSYSHAEGATTTAIGEASHAEGYLTTAKGDYSHVEGGVGRMPNLSGQVVSTSALTTIDLDFASGLSVVSSTTTQIIVQGDYSFITTPYTSVTYTFNDSTNSVPLDLAYYPTPIITTASYDGGLNETTFTFSPSLLSTYYEIIDIGNISSGSYSHAEGAATVAIGEASHTEGYGTIAEGKYQHVQGQFNLASSDQSAFIIGNGTGDYNRSNLLFASGSRVQITGSLEVLGGITGSLFGISGSTNRIPKFTGTNTLGDSNITDDGTTLTMTNNISIQDPNNPSSIYIGGTNTSMYLDASYGGGGATQIITRQSSGNQAKLVFGTGNISSYEWSLGTTNNAGLTDFKIAYGDIYNPISVALTIAASSKYVGINRTLPQYNLHVSGTVAFTDLTTTGSVSNIVMINPTTGQLYYTASSAVGGGSSTPTFPYTGSAIITGSLTITGSTTSTLGFTGSLFGTSSYVSGSVFTSTNPALSASYALSSSQSSNAITASYVTGSIYNSTNPALSASYALSSSYSQTASYALNVSSPFPFTGSAIITGSLTITGSTTSTLGFTGSLQGTASWANNATTASYIVTAQTASYVQTAQTASYVQNAQTASYVLNAVSSSLASTASYIVTAQTASYVLNAQTASYVQTAQTASFVTGSNVVGNITGNANNITAYTINQNLGTTSQVSFTAVTASFTGSLTGSLFGTASWATNVVSASGLNKQIQYNNNGILTGSSGLTWDDITKQFVVFGQGVMQGTSGITLPLRVDAFGADGLYIGQLAGEGIFSANSDQIIASFDTSTGIYYYANGFYYYDGTNHNIIGNTLITGSLNTTGSVLFRGLTTSQSVTNVVTINPSTGQLYYTASSAIGGGGPGGPVFPYDGAAVITGSLLVSGSGITVTGSLNADNITGSLQGTASWAFNAVTASEVLVTDTTSGTGYYVTFVDGTTADRIVRVDSNGLLFNATTNTLTVTSSYTSDFDDYDYLMINSFRNTYNY